MQELQDKTRLFMSLSFTSPDSLQAACQLTPGEHQIEFHRCENLLNSEAALLCGGFQSFKDLMIFRRPLCLSLLVDTNEISPCVFMCVLGAFNQRRGRETRIRCERSKGFKRCRDPETCVRAHGDTSIHLVVIWIIVVDYADEVVGV